MLPRRPQSSAAYLQSSSPSTYKAAGSFVLYVFLSLLQILNTCPVLCEDYSRRIFVEKVLQQK